MIKLNKQTIKRSIFLILIGATLFFFGSLINNTFHSLESQNIDTVAENNKLIGAKLQLRMEEYISSAREDTLYISSHLSQCVEQPCEEESMQEKIKQELSKFSGSYNVYKEFYYVNNKDSSVFIQENNDFKIEQELKKNLPDECLNIDGSPGMSKITYNNELVYISTPLYGNSDKPYGVFVTGISKNKLFTEFVSSLDTNIYIVDEQTKYLFANNEKRPSSDNLKSLLYNLEISDNGYIETEEGVVFTDTPFTIQGQSFYILVGAKKESVLKGTKQIHDKINLNFILYAAISIIVLALWFISERKTITVENLNKQKQELEYITEKLRNNQQKLKERNQTVENLNDKLVKENERYEEQKNTLQAITESIDEGIALISDSGKKAYTNKIWHEFFTFSKNSDNVNNILENMLVGVNNNEEILAEMKKENILQDFSKVYTVEFEQVQLDNKFFNLYSVPCKSAKGKIFGRIFVCRDITHRKEVDRLKSELISTVSHELRTPMTSVVGFAELLLTRDLSEERSREYINIIHSESKRLTNLINDFLDIQRMESGRQSFNMDLADPNDIISKSMQLYKDIDDKHKIIYENANKGLPKVNCDEDKIIQVLSNLLSNAIKYSPEGGNINIKSQKQNGNLMVSVTDCGLGIPDDEKSKLFTKFFRVDNDDRRKIGGTGLGLAICKEIINAHNGEIWAESTYGSGSTFYFTLPLADDKENKNLRKKHVKIQNDDSILIVEDGYNLVKLIDDVLTNDGFGTCTTDNGKDALKLIKKNDFKVIILDICLAGEMSGWDVVKVLKSNDKTAKIPVIISSIYENKDHSVSGNVKDYIVKPFDPQYLLQVIHKVIKEDFKHKMMVQDSGKIKEDIITMLNSQGIKVKKFKYNGDLLIITLDKEQK